MVFLFFHESVEGAIRLHIRDSWHFSPYSTMPLLFVRWWQIMWQEGHGRKRNMSLLLVDHHQSLAVWLFYRTDSSWCIVEALSSGSKKEEVEEVTNHHFRCCGQTKKKKKEILRPSHFPPLRTGEGARALVITCGVLVHCLVMTSASVFFPLNFRCEPLWSVISSYNPQVPQWTARSTTYFVAHLYLFEDNHPAGYYLFIFFSVSILFLSLWESPFRMLVSIGNYTGCRWWHPIPTSSFGNIHIWRFIFLYWRLGSVSY